MVYGDIYYDIVAYKLHTSISAGIQCFSLGSTIEVNSMKKVREYFEKAYNVLADLFAELPSVVDPLGSLVGLITMLLLIPILLKLLGM